MCCLITVLVKKCTLAQTSMSHAFNSLNASAGRSTFTSVATFVARVVTTVTLLLTLVGGNLILTATASGDLCTLACCAGRAPHAAGSCMQGSCAPGHAHHESETNEDSTDTPRAFAGAIAGAHGADINDVPTVEAVNSGKNSESSNVSAAALSKPCLPDCGACPSAFDSKRPDSSTRAGMCQGQKPQLLGIVGKSQLAVLPHFEFADDCTPRGPPSFI